MLFLRYGKVLASSKDIKDIISKVADEVKAKYISFEPEMIFTSKLQLLKKFCLSNKSLDNYIKTIEELPAGINASIQRVS